jgi:hypothetical protein
MLIMSPCKFWDNLGGLAIGPIFAGSNLGKVERPLREMKLIALVSPRGGGGGGGYTSLMITR